MSTVPLFVNLKGTVKAEALSGKSAGSKQPSVHRIAISRDESILFDPESLEIFVERLRGDGLSKDEGAMSTRLARYDKFQDNTDSCRITDDETDQHFNKALSRPHLSRLTLHVSNTCNLGCGYCYASGGDYGLGRKLMKSDQALDLLAKAFDVFDIDLLMFFGGEPSLNVDVITDCCLFVRELHRRELISELPRFAVISNFAGAGPRFDQFLAVCKQFNIAVTVSIDGPPEIHNKNRPTLSGKGSYDRVRDNFLRAKEAGIEVGIECTYSKQQSELGISVVDLMKFFYEEFGERHTHIAPASCSPISSERSTIQDLIDAYCEAIKFMIETLDTPEYLSIDMNEQLIRTIAEQEPISNYCPAGNSELTIGPEGELYPCFMFVGHSEFKMGPIGEDKWLSSRGAEILGKIQRNGKKDHPVCQNCWARNVCSGCIGGDYLETNSLAVKPQCAMIMGTAAEAIVRLAEKGQGLPIGEYGNSHRHSYLSYVEHLFTK
jgi:uncharacterized protein